RRARPRAVRPLDPRDERLPARGQRARLHAVRAGRGDLPVLAFGPLRGHPALARHHRGLVLRRAAGLLRLLHPLRPPGIALLVLLAEPDGPRRDGAVDGGRRPRLPRLSAGTADVAGVAHALLRVALPGRLAPAPTVRGADLDHRVDRTGRDRVRPTLLRPVRGQPDLHHHAPPRG